MAEFEKIIDIDIHIGNQKPEENLPKKKSFKLHLFEALYIIQQLYGFNKFLDIIFTIIEFKQLISFPMDKIFDSSWGNSRAKIILNYFRFFQFIDLFKGTSFLISTYILVCIYIIIFFSLFIYIIIKSNSSKSNFAVKIIVLMLQLEAILNIPFLQTLFSVFPCNNDTIESYKAIKCKNVIHIILIFISILLVIIYESLIILFHMTLYEFGTNTNKLKAAYSCSTDVILDIIKLILVILYNFKNNKIVLSIITTILSIIIFVRFLKIQPYSNGFTMKLYFILYSLFCWSCIICFIRIFINNAKFNSGIILLLLGYPLLLIIIHLKGDGYILEKLFSFLFMYNHNKYSSLLNIEYYLKFEDSFTEKLKRREFTLLLSYISSHEMQCSENNCSLKKFIKAEFKLENFSYLKILFFQHAEKLYKNALSKEPNNIKLKISYILFLINKMNQRQRAKNELLLLDNFDPDFESTFLIYKIQRYINETENNIETGETKDITKNIIIKEIK